jgi:predicted MFS family arabinose efflux permease
MKQRPLIIALGLLTVARLLLNTGHRLVSPFLPVIARGLGIPLESAGVLVAARSAAAMATPAIVTAGRRYDRRALVHLGLAMFCIGSGIAAVVGVYGGVLVGFVLMGLGKAVFDVSGQAYLSDRVPYESRARWLAAFETTWAGGFLIGAPIVGWLISLSGWETAYGVIAVLLGVSLIAALALLDEDHAEMAERGRLALDRSAWGMLAVASLFAAGGEFTTVVLGAWLEDSFAIALAGIAGLASLIGVAELTGAFSTGLFTDRLGKKRAVSIGLVINAIGYTTMGMSGASVVLGIGGALVAFLGFEFLIVSSFPLASELVPGGRGRYLAWLVVAISLGRALAGAIGPILFTSIGFGGNATAAVVVDLLALVVLRSTVTEPGMTAAV